MNNFAGTSLNLDGVSGKIQFPKNWISSETAQSLYGRNTIGTVQKIIGAAQPRTVQEIQEIVRWAAKEKCQLYTFSTGKNWGYGSSTPAKEGCFIVDLSKMDQVVEWNEDLSFVTVEPGVTQQKLYDYLQAANSVLMVPTTGAGPDASIMGNALDKGFGITPTEDHFAAIISLQAVLADGSIYESTLKGLGGHKSDQVFKWKTGAYLDGLFGQSNLGIVTKITIALARRPEHLEQYIAFVEDEHLESVVNAIRRIRQNLGTVSGGINLMNQQRVLALMDTEKSWPIDRPIEDIELKKLAKKNGASPWIVMGALYGPKKLVKAAKSEIEKELGIYSRRLVFLNRGKFELARLFLRVFPIQTLQRMVAAAEQGFYLLEGKPSRMPLRLAYLKNPVAMKEDSQPSPDRDRCGLIWFAPLLPVDDKLIRVYTTSLVRICHKYNLEPIITLISVSERCFDSPIPLLFNPDEQGATENAHACLKELLQMCESLGVLPHRMDVLTMQKYFNRPSVSALEMYRKIKLALDPLRIFSPGKFSAE